jgi:hypothetical protein
LLPQNCHSNARHDDGKEIERTKEPAHFHLCVQQQRKQERNGNLQWDVNEQKRQRVTNRLEEERILQ